MSAVSSPDLGFFRSPQPGKTAIGIAAVAGLRGHNVGQRVSFEVEADKQGPLAVNLKLV